MNFTKARAGALVGILGLTASAAFIACGGDDTNPGTTNDAGKDTSPGADTAPPPSDSQPPPDVAPPPDAGTLYTRLGGHAGIKAFVGAVVVELLKDPEEASYFTLNVPTPYPNRASADDIAECFTDLAGSVVQGPETYPMKTPSGYQCRSLTESHKAVFADGGPSAATDINFHIPNDVFDKFIVTAGLVATKAGIKAADVGTVGTLLKSQHDAIVDPNQPDGSYFDAANFCDASDTRPGCAAPGDAGTDAPDAD